MSMADKADKTEARRPGLTTQGANKPASGKDIDASDSRVKQLVDQVGLDVEEAIRLVKQINFF